jgi:glycine dehydrogenase subunit 2
MHKTFATPHGGGGPGAGPVGVTRELAPLLPGRVIIKDKHDRFGFSAASPQSIGTVAPFLGNFAVLIKALAYILILGKEGLKRVSDIAVLNANYLAAKLKNYFELPFTRRYMHECVFSASAQKENGVSALDIAKFLIQEGVHPPTIYFPLIVKEALMVEPTETESKSTLDDFIKIMIKAAELAQKEPDALKRAPQNFIFSRLDEVRAARNRDLNYRSQRQQDD